MELAVRAAASVRLEELGVAGAAAAAALAAREGAPVAIRRAAAVNFSTTKKNFPEKNRKHRWENVSKLAETRKGSRAETRYHFFPFGPAHSPPYPGNPAVSVAPFAIEKQEKYPPRN